MTATLQGDAFTNFSISTALAGITGQGAAVTTGSVVLTSVSPITTIDSAFIQANAGNDTIALGTSLTRITATDLKAGAGNDFIGFGSQIRDAFVTGTNASVAIKDSKIVGGAGNDTVHLAGASTMTATEISAGAGNDSLMLTDQHIYSARIGLGGGNDILADGIDEITDISIQGGAGNDTIYLSATESSTIGGDALGNLVASTDGNDSIIVGGTTNQTKIYGGGGNDVVTLSAGTISDTGNLISLGAGRDTLNLDAAVTINSATIGLGGDNDLVQISDDATVISGATFKLGAGSDTLKFTTGDLGTNGIGSGSLFASATIFGGAGNDLIFDSANNDFVAGGTINAVFGYNTSDSTLAGYDTIAVGGGSVTATYKLNIAGASLAQAQLQTADFTASNSVIAFTSTFSQDLTARVESLDANLATGEVALFQESNNGLTYLFIQGGSSTDTVVQLGTAEFTDSNSNALSASVTVSGTTLQANL